MLDIQTLNKVLELTIRLLEFALVIEALKRSSKR